MEHVYIYKGFESLLCFIKTKDTAYVCIQWDKLIKSKLDLFIIKLCMEGVFSYAGAVAAKKRSKYSSCNRHMLITGNKQIKTPNKHKDC